MGAMSVLYRYWVLEFYELIGHRRLFFTFLLNPILCWAGIRSLSFKKDLITIGTGMGEMLFYDVRACRYLLDHNSHHSEPYKLTAGAGWLVGFKGHPSSSSLLLLSTLSIHSC